jgi:DNA (cytosine-5)-methyltransferase 1
MMAPTLIDLFSGCGGVSQGFKNQGFRVLAAIEWDPVTAKTYRKNHPEVVLYEDDIKSLDPNKIIEQCHLERNELTVLSACAPCQPFSRQNRKASTDERTKLVLEMLRFVAVFRPRFVIMENVPGLAKGKNKPILSRLIESLRENLGYHILTPKVIDAVNYGVPQFRKRLILLGSREDVDLSIPDVTHVSPQRAEQTEKPAWKTVRDAFRGVHRLAAGQQSRTDPLHRARNHKPISLQRLKYIPKNGGSRHSLPEHLQLACHKNSSGFNDVYGRMDFSRPSNTLTTGCTNFTKGRFAHPTANRAITPREAARLQTFPDAYQFIGGYEQISTQIGNAVPVKLAEIFGEYFYHLSDSP